MRCHPSVRTAISLIPVERADEIRHRIEAKERDQLKRCQWKSGRNGRGRSPKGKPLSRKGSPRWSGHAALREATNERVAIAEQPDPDRPEPIMRPSRRIRSSLLAQWLQDQAELIEREKQDAVDAVNAKALRRNPAAHRQLEDLARHSNGNRK